MVTIHIYTLCTIYFIIMSYLKILYIVALVMCIVPVAFCEDTEDETGSMFEETTDGLFDDLEVGLKELIMAIVGIFALYSIAAIIVGWFSHNNKLFKSGVSGCGIIILAAIAYFLAINGFNYFVDNYW